MSSWGELGPSSAGTRNDGMFLTVGDSYFHIVLRLIFHLGFLQPSIQKILRMPRKLFAPANATLSLQHLQHVSRRAVSLTVLSIFFDPEGFEEEFDPRSKAYLRQGPQLDVYVVPLAGIWILLCGNIIFAHCRNQVTPDYNDAGKNWK